MTKRSVLFWVLVTLSCCVSVYFNKDPHLRFLPGALLICFLPGYALAKTIFRSDALALVERFCLSIGLSIAVSSIGILILHYLLGEINLLLALTFLSSVTIFFLVTNLFRKESPIEKRQVDWKSWAFLALLIIYASFFRFTYLGYSEFQGDEAHNCLLTSIQVLEGNREALFLQERGPTQALISAIAYLVFNSHHEGLIRFPFALAGLAAVLAIYLIGRNMFSHFVGIVSGFLAAICGYLVVFSRIVQYQSIVILSVCLSILLLYKFLISEKNDIQSKKYILLGFFFFSFGVFTHYDGIFIFPLLIYIIFLKFRSGTFSNPLRWLVSSGLIALTIGSLFYLPFIFHPHFIETLRMYQRTRLESTLNFHLDILSSSGSLYNSSAYLLFLAILSLFAFIKKINIPLTLILAWFISYFVFLMVVISKPDTHLYNFFPPWCVLAAIGLKNLHDLKISKLKNWLSIKAYHFIIGSCFFLFMLWCSFYIHTVFIKHNPEYLWKLSAHELPRHGFFGFPYHRSWKTVGYLFRTKILEGTYTGNEKQRISNFYLKQKKTPKRYKEKCKYFILCQNPQSWKEVSPPITFVPSIQILSSGKPTITIYEDAKNVSETKTYRSEDYEKLYDELDKKSEHP